MTLSLIQEAFQKDQFSNIKHALSNTTFGNNLKVEAMPECDHKRVKLDKLYSSDAKKSSDIWM